MLFGNFSRASTSCCLASASRSSAIFASASLAIVSGESGSILQRRVEARERLGEAALVQQETALAVQRLDVARVELHGLREGLARFARRRRARGCTHAFAAYARESSSGDAFARAGPSSTLARSASACAGSTGARSSCARAA